LPTAARAVTGLEVWKRVHYFLGVLIATPALWAQPVAKHLTFDDIIATAREHAAKPFAPSANVLPEELRGDKLNYDSYREIRFRHDKALWAREELPFRLEFFHPGYLYQMPVSIYEFNDTHVQPVRFVQDFFDYGKLKLPRKIPAETGYAGFKLLYPLNASNRWDELASFLGASYFRCLGKDQRYGESARGLAINCGEPDRPEEFPVFSTWWISKPDKQSNTLHLFALLESASCTGAYEFLLKPGENTAVDINVALFFRGDKDPGSLKTIGFAPLTSMFWFGENSERKADDYRPEVHDSDGLLVRLENDEFIWSPLQNPKALQHPTFPANNIRGFGLLQRDRAFSAYQDLFNAYHRVPSVWVEPHGNWGEGEVHLVELTTTGEGSDNIVAFWNPTSRPVPNQPFRFGYTLFWTMDPNVSERETKFPRAKVLQTRTGLDRHNGQKRQFVIDFSDVFEGAKPRAEVRSGGKSAISDVQVFENEFRKAWRVFFSLTPDAQESGPVDIECWLERGEDISSQTNSTSPASETWRYVWNPSSQKSAPR
jgi:glucans biosynthesis protein